MAMFHTRMGVVKRSVGKSAVAGAAYDSRSRLTDERTGVLYDFRRAHRHERLVADLGVCLPDGADPRLSDRSFMWNEAERAERSSLAQTARRIECSLPSCMSEGEQLALARSIVGYFTAQDMAVDASVHDALDGHNPHLHMQMPQRPVGPEGFMPKSVNVYSVRDADGHEAELTADELKARLARGETWEKQYTYRLGRERRVLTPSEAEAWAGCKRQGRNPVQSTRYLVDWNDRARAREWRRAIADMTNDALAAHGYGGEKRVDPRSYKEQGVDKIPTLHEGTAVTVMEAAADGGAPVTDRRRENLRIGRANEYLRRLAERLAKLLAALRLLREARRREAARRGGGAPAKARQHGARKAPRRQRNRNRGLEKG